MLESSSTDERLNPNAPRASIEHPVRMRNVIGLACDFKTRRYFFSDIQRGDIQSVNFDGTDFTVIVQRKSQLGLTIIVLDKDNSLIAFIEQLTPNFNFLVTLSRFGRVCQNDMQYGK